MLSRTTHGMSIPSIIFLATVVFPEAEPPQTPMTYDDFAKLPWLQLVLLLRFYLVPHWICTREVDQQYKQFSKNQLDFLKIRMVVMRIFYICYLRIGSLSPVDRCRLRVPLIRCFPALTAATISSSSSCDISRGRRFSDDFFSILEYFDL